MLKNLKIETSGNKTVLISILVIFILRIAFINLMGLMPQDAYYYFYSQHPALSYFDHPPVLAWILKGFTDVLGKHVFVLKLADSAVSFLSLIAFYKLCECFLSKHRIQSAVILFFSTLMLTILSLISTPDVPLILFWCLSLRALYKAVFLEQNIYWIWSGIFMGLAFDSKYTGLFLPIGIVLFLLLSNKYRKLIFSKWLWFSFIVFLITISPVIVWNIQTHFASIKFQSSDRVHSIGLSSLNPVSFLGVIGHQSAILMPILFFLLIMLLYKNFRRFVLKRRVISSQQLFLFCFFIPAFLGFISISWIYWVKLNWIMPAYITGIILVSTYVTRRILQYQLLFSLTVHIILAIEVIFYPVSIKSDDTWEGWDKLAANVQLLKSKYHSAFIFSEGYKTSAVLNFYLNEMVYSSNIIGKPALQFDYIGSDLSVLKDSDALFINSVPGFKSEQKENQISPVIFSYFDTVTELDPIIIKRGERPIRKFLVFMCKKYKPAN